MVIENEKLKKIVSKLARPLHYKYISRYILECSDEECIKALNKLVSDGLIKESEFSGYYVIK